MNPLLSEPIVPRSSGGYRRGLLTSARAAGIILLAFWLFTMASLMDKSATADEPGDIMSGYTYWRLNDYRMIPEHGNLPLRLMALPLLFGNYHFPSTADEAWLKSDQGTLSYNWFYGMNNDADSMLFRSRAISGLLAVVLGALVWLWARQLFGPPGGMLSLLLYVFNPTILANGALATTDMACSLFFLASVWSLWAALDRLSLRRVLLSALVMGGLFVSKLSAVLMVPVALVLVTARLISGQPLWAGPGRGWKLERRSRQAMAFAAAAAVHVVMVAAVVWAFYGFRYTMFAQAVPGRDRPLNSWGYLLGKPSPFTLLDKLNLSAEQTVGINKIFQAQQVDPLKVTDGYSNMELFQTIKQTVLTSGQAQEFDAMVSAPPPAFGARMIDFIHRCRLLPEAYVYGYANVWKYAQARSAFFNGKIGIYGWKWFFPYTFLVKTPLSVFSVMALALAAAAAKWRVEGKRLCRPPWYPGLRALYATLPLWVLPAFYWATLISSHSDVGHRYIMPVYAPLFVLCGTAVYWPSGLRKRDDGSGTVAATGKAARLAGLVLWASMLLLAAEVLGRFPNYLAYFNGIVTPAKAYRHLVDSSLDWGQDLPGLRHYIEKHRLGGPVYLSYFGNGSPDYYKIPATYIYSSPGQDVLELMPIFKLPAAKANAMLADRLSQHPDYDLLGRWVDDEENVIYALLKKPATLRLTGGTYFISATMLQPVTGDSFGSWNALYEASYQRHCRMVKPLLQDNIELRMAALQKRPLRKWQEILRLFDAERFARLTAYLRRREPDDNVNFSILVYKLTDADMARALDGPLSGLSPVPDLPTL